MKEIKIITTDNFEIIANHFSPEKSNSKVIVINAATGIKQGFYFKYATFLTQNGYDVITYDYRGIGLSKHQPLKGFDASMTDWASKDFTAVILYVKSNFNTHKKILVGHSFGGNSIGMSSEANSFDAYITIASQFGYWKFFNASYQPFLLWLFFIAMPLMTKIYGYFPSRVKKLGEELPKGVALDWITLMTNSNSMLTLSAKSGNFYETIKKPMLIISISDDQLAPQKAVDELSKRVYKNALTKRLHIVAEKIKPIGHLNFFKKQFETDLWTIPTNWIETLELK